MACGDGPPALDRSISNSSSDFGRNDLVDPENIRSPKIDRDEENRYEMVLSTHVEASRTTYGSLHKNLEEWFSKNFLSAVFELCSGISKLLEKYSF